MSNEEKKTTPFTKAVKTVIKSIPAGKIATYGQIAALAGNPRAARMVVRILHSSSKSDNLPWHRIINSKGTISLRPGQGYELQKQLLEDEGIEFGIGDKVDFKKYLFNSK
ncbi:MAG: MGMT family protein [candidate division Zixibacteria bacterium]|nr:MGMT family protein [candidate division Zixibacteria bacterium]